MIAAGQWLEISSISHGKPRSFRSHTLFVRSVDDKGQVDPSPAHISFTATTLVPTCRAVYPNLASQNVQTVPPTVNLLSSVICWVTPSWQR